MRDFCTVIEATEEQRPGYASSIGYNNTPAYLPQGLPDVLTAIYQHAIGTPHEIAEQKFMDFTPGHRLMLASEIPGACRKLQDFYGRDDMFDVHSRTPFLTNYSSDYYLADNNNEGVYYLDHVEGSYLVSRNMSSFMQTVLACYRRGAYFADSDGWIDTNSDLENQIYAELNPDIPV